MRVQGCGGQSQLTQVDITELSTATVESDTNAVFSSPSGLSCDLDTDQSPGGSVSAGAILSFGEVLDLSVPGPFELEMAFDTLPDLCGVMFGVTDDPADVGTSVQMTVGFLRDSSSNVRPREAVSDTMGILSASNSVVLARMQGHIDEDGDITGLYAEWEDSSGTVVKAQNMTGTSRGWTSNTTASLFMQFHVGTASEGTKTVVLDSVTARQWSR